MQLLFVQRLRFYALQAGSEQPITLASCVFTGVLFVCVLFVYFQQASAATSGVDMELDRVAPVVRGNPAEGGSAPQLVLPAFDSTAFVQQLREAGKVAQFPLDDLAFTLDDGGKTPYLRYRVKVSATAGYPQFRRFINTLRERASNVAVDGMNCAREDIDVDELTCELSLSAFYRVPADD